MLRSLWARVKALVSPPVFEGDEDKTRTARLLNIVLWALLVVSLAVSPLIVLAEEPLTGLVPVATLLLLDLVGLLLMRSGRVRVAGVVFTGSLWLVETGFVLFSGGLGSEAASGYLVVVTAAGLLLGGAAAIAFAGLSLASVILLFYVESVGALPPNLLAVSPLFKVSLISANIVMIAVLLYLAVQSIDEALASARRYAGELEEQRSQLENLVEDRTQELSRRTSYLGATTAVAREAASQRGELEKLLASVAEAIGMHFGFYHVGLFLLDSSGDWVELRASSSEGGQRMLARGHRLQVGGQGIVGYVASQGVPRIALEVGDDTAFVGNPDLPETRSEVALPLRIRGEILGVVDVQSRESGAFSEEDIGVLQALTDQVAVAIDSAGLLEQLQQSIEAERRAYGELSREAWMSLLRAQPDLGFVSDEQGTVAAGGSWRPEMRTALYTGDVVPSEEDQSRLALPVRVRDQVVGVIGGRKRDGSGWAPEERELLEEMVAQLNVALEGAQLYRDAQRRETRERAIGQVASRMRESLDLQQVLQGAAEEMRQTLGLERVVVRLSASEVEDAGA